MFTPQTVIVIILTIIVCLAIYIPFILTMQNTLKLVRPANRKIDMQLLWILLVPTLGFAFLIIISKKVAQSIELEMTERKMQGEPKPTYIAGLACGIFTLIVLLKLLFQYIFMPELLTSIPYGIFSFFLSVCGLIIFIIYWVQIAECKKKLLSTGYMFGHDTTEVNH